MNFNLSSILNSLNRALGSLANTIGSGIKSIVAPKALAPTSAPQYPAEAGGYFGPNSAASSGLSNLITAALANVISPQGPTYYQSGKVSGGNIIPVASGQTPGQTSIPSASQLSAGGGTSWGAPSTSGPSTTGGLGGYSAPKPVSTPPAQTLPAGGFSSTTVSGSYGASPNISGGGAPGYVSGGTGISGYAAPVAGMAVPPPPVSINKPTTPPIGQYEAMVRELQKLNPGGYIQTPLKQTPTYGPAYGMGSALKKLQEYQGMYR